jgi:hypothetical protein
MATEKNFQATDPTAPAGAINGVWQVDPTASGTDATTGQSYFDTSVYGPNVGTTLVKTVNYTAVAGDNGTLLSFNSSSAVTLTLPNPIATIGTLPSSIWKIAIQNIGAGTLTVNPNGLNIDGSAASLVIAQGTGLDIYTDGTNYFTMRGGAIPLNNRVGVIGITIDGGGSVPSTGLKGYAQIPFAATITGWSIIADQAGSASIDIWALAGSAPPTAPSIPTSANKISASAPVALATAQSAAGGTSAITTWTTAISQWMTVAFNLTSITTCTRLTIELQVLRS